MRRMRRAPEKLLESTSSRAAVARASRSQPVSLPNSVGLFGQTLLTVQGIAGNRAAARMAEAAAVQREPDTDQQRKDAETAKGSSLTLSDLGTFEIISFSFSESRPGSGGSGTQAPNPREIHVTRVPDENSTKIQELALKGESIGSMQIVTSTGAIVGTKVIIASFNVAASRDRPIESFTLAVGEPGFTFQPAGAAAP